MDFPPERRITHPWPAQSRHLRGFDSQTNR
jgi:hypothetical protein